MQRPQIESLEPRQLFAATTFPNLLGQFSGPIDFSNGDTDSETLTILVQRKGSYSGEIFQASGITSKTSGTVTKKGVIHSVTHGINVKFTSRFNGEISGDLIAGSFVTQQGKLKFSGVVSLSRI